MVLQIHTQFSVAEMVSLLIRLNLVCMVLILTRCSRTAVARNNSIQVRTDPVELEAVYAVMSATGNSWAAHIPDVCKSRWHGIECTSAPDADGYLHVTSLSFGTLSDDTAFPSCAQNAFISPAISSLSHLQRLFFYRCSADNPQPIPGAILATLGPTLQVLVLRKNGHVGAIPPLLASHLPNLQRLDLHGNALSGAIPPAFFFSPLPELRVLDLSHNKLAGDFPVLNKTRLTRLTILDLSYNNLSGPLPPLSLSFPALKKLDLCRNEFSGSLSVTDPFPPSLLLLDLSFNRLSGALPARLPLSLQTLIMDNAGNFAAPLPPSGFSDLRELQVMILSSAGLPGPIPDIFHRLQSLRILRLDKNRLRGAIPRSLGNVPHLGDLRLDGNLLEGRIPFSAEFVWRLGGRLRVKDNLGLCFDVQADSLQVQGVVISKSCSSATNNIAEIERLQQSIVSPDRASFRRSSPATPASISSSSRLRYHYILLALLLFLCSIL